MTVTAHNHQLQKLLASSLCSLIFALLYLAARHFLEAGAALVVTAVTVLGSSLTSTMGVAFWNVNVSLLFIALSLWLIARDTNRAALRHPYFLGSFLFAAYFSRPTSAAFILPVLVYLAGWRRDSFIRAAAALGLGLLGFVLFSWLAYGRFFPDYYALARFDRSYQVGRVFLGCLFSPSRGWFVFSPFLALALIGLLFYLRRLAKRPLFWLCLGWIALHLAAVSHIGHWWGGHSFGPRLLADIVPAAFLLTVLLWQEARKTIGTRLKRTAVAVYLALGLFAIFVNSYQALYNTSSKRWNDYPNVDDYPEYVWDWRYPQFLASPHVLEARYRQHLEREAGG